MSARGALQVGTPIQVAIGTIQASLIDRSILGIWMPISGTVTIYDSPTTSGLPAPIMPATVLPLGWNPFPADTTKGIVITTTVACVLIAS